MMSKDISFYSDIIYFSGSLILMIFLLSACQCQSGQKEAGPDVEKKMSHLTLEWQIPVELTSTEKMALAALDTLQVHMEDYDRLYSTFPDIEHSFYPFEREMLLSQSDLLFAMQDFLQKHKCYLSETYIKSLLKEAVLAQEPYRVLICKTDEGEWNEQKGPPKKGVWVIPGILNRRDLILRWE